MSTSLPPLLRLPSEILTLIYSSCPSARDKAVMSASCHHLYDIFQHRLLRFNLLHQNGSAVMWAAQKGRLDILQRLRSAGAELNDTAGSIGARPPFLEPRLQELDSDINDDDEVDRKWDFYCSPLHLAAREGHDHIVSWLLDNGARIDAPSRDVCQCSFKIWGFHSGHGFAAERPGEEDLWTLNPQWTPLHIAICNQRVSTAKLLVRRGASMRVSKHKRDMITAFHTAAMSGCSAIIDFLAITRPSVVHELDHYRNNAIHFATVARGQTPNFRQLVDLGLDIEHPNRFRRTPLLSACWSSHVDYALALVEAGANSDIQPRGVAPIHLVSGQRQRNIGCSDLDDETWEESRQNLLARLDGVTRPIQQTRRLPPGAKTADTALMIAAIDQPVRVMEILLDAGADVNAASANGTPLSYALTDYRQTHSDEKIRLLIERGAVIDFYYGSGTNHTSFLTTIAGDESLSVLLDTVLTNSKVPKNVSFHNLSRNATECFNNRAYASCRRLMAEKGADLNVYPSKQEIIRQALKEGDLPKIKLLLDLFPEEEMNETLMAYTIEFCCLESAELLFERAKAPITGRSKSFDDSCLHLACRRHGWPWYQRDDQPPHGCEQPVEKLLERGADINDFNASWQTPLACAISEKRSDMVKLLLDKGADPFITPTEGKGFKLADDIEQDCLVQAWRQDRGVTIEYRTPFVQALWNHEMLKLILDKVPISDIPEIQVRAALSRIHLFPRSVALLLKHGGDPNRGLLPTKPPILIALELLQGEHPNPEPLSMLVKAGADLDVVTKDGRAVREALREFLSYDVGQLPEGKFRDLVKAVQAVLDVNCVWQYELLEPFG